MNPRRARELTTCGHCGEDKRCSRVILDKSVCERCALRFSRAPGRCPGCREPKILAFYDSAGRPACATCTGHRAVYACGSCGREDRPFGRRCAVCVLAERAGTLLADGTGRIHPRLQPVFDALMAARRPQSVIYWLDRSTGPGLLASMARGEIDISHAAFEALPADKATRYVRHMLAAVGVLEPYDARLEQLTPWLTATLAALPAADAEVIGRFARWQVVRRLRHRADAGVLTASSVENGRAAILTAIRFLAWLERRHRSVATATQADLDRYLVAYPGRGEVLAPFVAWTNKAGLTSNLAMPGWRRGPPTVVLSDGERWAQVELLLHDDTVPLYVRVAGLLTLLFAQPLTRICRMTTDQIAVDPSGTVTVTFDAFPIELPDPLDGLLLEQLSCPGQASFPAQPGPWLFPGGLPGNHLSTESVRSHLTARGIQPSHARKAAMFQLAGDMPAPVLAEVLGLATNTAVRWATLAARDWRYYIALRHDSEDVTEAGPGPHISGPEGRSARSTQQRRSSGPR
ncbi:MAG: hypothetical protein ACRD0J_07170 [Acidimicrobiales bacterium]